MAVQEEGALFLSYSETKQGISYLRGAIQPHVDYNDGNALSEQLVNLSAAHTYSATVMASADYHAKKDKKNEEKQAVKLLAERLNNTIGSRIRTYITLVSALKAEKQFTR